jgi:hypothetical protein
MMPGLTHCVAGRFMPFGGGPACSWTREDGVQYLPSLTDKLETHEPRRESLRNI